MNEYRPSPSDEFKRYISGVFTRASTLYDHVGPKLFSYFGERLVDFADIREGAHVLDVASGRGAVLFPASNAASSTGEVIGIDIAEGMIEHTRNEISHLGIANARVLQMDAENLVFQDAAFDNVLCGLGLFFFPNLDGALAEFRRVLKPGGQFVSSTFQTLEDERMERWRELNEAFKDNVRPAPIAERKMLGSEDEIRESLSLAGFVEIEIATDQRTFYFSSEEEWWQSAWSTGFRSLLERMDAETLANYKKQMAEVILEETEHGIPETWHLFYTKARKP